MRDAGSPGGLVLQLDLIPGMQRLQAAGRFLAPAGRYFPALLPEEAPQQRLTELALGELARGGRWVKVIADFPSVVDGMPSGTARPTYTSEAIEAMVTAVHAAGGLVAAHVTTDSVSQLVRAGVDSIEHGTAIDESALRLMAQTGPRGRPRCVRCSGFPAPHRRRSEAGRRLPAAASRAAPARGPPRRARTCRDRHRRDHRPRGRTAGRTRTQPSRRARGRDHHRVPLPRRAVRPTRAADDVGDLPQRSPRGSGDPVDTDRDHHRRPPRPLTPRRHHGGADRRSPAPRPRHSQYAGGSVANVADTTGMLACSAGHGSGGG